MSVCSKIYLGIDPTRAFEVYSEVLAGVSEFVAFKRDQWLEARSPGTPLPIKEMRERFMSPHIEGFDFSLLTLVYTVKGKQNVQSLNMHSNCSSEINNVLEGKKLIFSTSNETSNETMFNFIMNRIKHFGPIYYTLNCSEGFIKFNSPGDDL